MFVINKYDTYAFCLESSTKQACHTAWVTFHVLRTGRALHSSQHSRAVDSHLGSISQLPDLDVFLEHGPLSLPQKACEEQTCKKKCTKGHIHITQLHPVDKASL